MGTDFNFKELKIKIESATKKSFKENIQKYGSDICSFSLVSDDGAMTVVPYTNTQSFLDKNQLENLEYKDDYEFITGEWFSSDGANAEFNTICNIINTEVLKEGLEFDHFKDQLFETCIQVLEKLRSEDFFKKELGRDILILFDISDTLEPEENIIKWAKRLNNEETGSRFENFMNDQLV